MRDDDEHHSPHDNAGDPGAHPGPTVIARHIDHAPEVKALVDELFGMLAAGGGQDYRDAIAAEYCRPGQQITHRRVGDGVLSVVTDPPRGQRPGRVTHLVYGHCTSKQIRADLVARGLGSLPIVSVYPPAVLLDPAAGD
ncbi:hypothetical protein BC739_009355 [Kutzneria viridogrisea]|uniref:Uncharacterized protein n=1 Tax=Kutzneria viridogrisea TaxID=47990 RepID=A0ABR6BYV4_9PSEU|nr:hypothetical protein [Kutzneria albida]MBA8932096.1 hypothetical protein [Kutzneria viridogrisea]